MSVLNHFIEIPVKSKRLTVSEWRYVLIVADKSFEEKKSVLMTKL